MSLPFSPVTTTGGVSDRNHEHVVLRTDSINQNERKPRNRHVMTIAPNCRIRSGIGQQTFNGAVGLLEKPLCRRQRLLAIPGLRLPQFFQRESMKLDHAWRSARSCAWTDSQGIPCEASLARHSRSSRSPGSSIDQPGESSEIVSISSVARSKRSDSDNSIADLRTSSRVVNIVTTLRISTCVSLARQSYRRRLDRSTRVFSMRRRESFETAGGSRPTEAGGGTIVLVDLYSHPEARSASCGGAGLTRGRRYISHSWMSDRS